MLPQNGLRKVVGNSAIARNGLRVPFGPASAGRARAQVCTQPGMMMMGGENCIEALYFQRGYVARMTLRYNLQPKNHYALLRRAVLLRL
jgi:hypothetical protein